MVVQAYAKLNLVLNVDKEKIGDYHKIESLMIPVSLHDTIDISILKDGKDSYITCDNFELVGEKYNLVTKAIDLLRLKFGFKENFRIIIYKRIFISAGLGGGSADAAAVIRGIVKLLHLEISDAELIELGMQIGSDVPFCLFNKPAVAKGKGEKLAILDDFDKRYHFLIIKPKVSLKTKDVYDEFDKINEQNHFDIEKTIEAYNKGCKELEGKLFNALEPAAFNLAPEVKELINSLKDEGQQNVMMSGSGSAVFVLSDNRKNAFKIMKRYSELGYSVEYAKSI